MRKMFGESVDVGACWHKEPGELLELAVRAATRAVNATSFDEDGELKYRTESYKLTVILEEQ